MQYGTGCFHKKDERDYIFGATAPAPFDWDKGCVTDTSTLKIKSQNGSLSCVAQSTASMVEILTGDEKSARYIYSQIFLQDGGAYMREGIDVGAKQLISCERDFSSYPATEDNLRDKKGLDIKLDPEPDTYASVPVNIDSVACAIRDSKCVMIGANGNNEGWSKTDVEFMQTDWGHAVVGIGAVIRGGKKCIRFRNSWGIGWGYNGDGFFSEEYFKNGIMAVFAYTNNFYKPKDKAMEYIEKNENKLVQNGDTGEIAIIKGKEILVTSAERAGLLALTYIIRNGGGGAVPKELWDAFPKSTF